MDSLSMRHQAYVNSKRDLFDTRLLKAMSLGGSALCLETYAGHALCRRTRERWFEFIHSSRSKRQD